MLKIKSPNVVCNNCGHKWTPRSKKVYTCPKCHSCCHLEVEGKAKKCSN